MTATSAATFTHLVSKTMAARNALAAVATSTNTDQDLFWDRKVEYGEAYGELVEHMGDEIIAGAEIQTAGIGPHFMLDGQDLRHWVCQYLAEELGWDEATAAYDHQVA